MQLVLYWKREKEGERGGDVLADPLKQHSEAEKRNFSWNK